MLENYVAIDLEMTGLNAKTESVLETAAVRVREGNIAETYTALIRPKKTLSSEIVKLTGITEEMAAGGREEKEVMDEFLRFLGEDILVGHNVIFDYSFLKQWAVNQKISFERSAVDTLKLARKFLPKEQKKDLESLCNYYGIARKNAHRALDDALAAQEILERLKIQFADSEPESFLSKPLIYKAKRQTPATLRQKENLQRYAAYYGIQVPPELSSMTRSEASRMMDVWIGQYGKLPK